MPFASYDSFSLPWFLYFEIAGDVFSGFYWWFRGQEILLFWGHICCFMVISIKPETASHTAEQFSWVPLPYCSPPRRPFPIKYLALSAHVSPWTIHFRVLNESPVSGPGRGLPSCNRMPAGNFFPCCTGTAEEMPEATRSLETTHQSPGPRTVAPK